MHVIRLERLIHLILLSAIVSVVLSIWCVWADPIVNNDGVYYFRTAKEIVAGDWSSAISLYAWPFYPALISAVSTVSGLSVEVSTHVVNALLYVLLVTAFLAAVSELEADRRVMLIAAAIILTLPSVNKYRSYVIRDAGFWALYLYSLAFLFRYVKTRSRTSILGWASCITGAFLFRVEAVTFMVGVPMLLYYRDGLPSRPKWGVALLLPLFIAVLFVLLVTWVFRSDMLLNKAHLPGDVLDGMQQSWMQLTEGVRQKIMVLREQFLQYSSKRHAWLAYMTSLTVVAFAELVRGMSVVYAVIAGYGAIARSRFPLAGARFLWLGLIAINALVVLGFTMAMGFVVRRYMMAMIFTALLVVPFVFSYLYDTWWLGKRNRKSRIAFVTLIVLCAVVSLKGLDVFTDKHHLRDAGYWLKANTPERASLYSDSLILVYYSGKPAYHPDDIYDWNNTVRMIRKKRWKEYDYLAVEVGRGEQKNREWLLRKLAREPVQVFKNRKGDEVLIFQTRNGR